MSITSFQMQLLSSEVSKSTLMSWKTLEITFSWWDWSKGRCWRPFQPRQSVRTLFGQVCWWRGILWSSDRSYALAVWLHICFGCILLWWGFWTCSPEAWTLLAIRRRGRGNPWNPSWFFPGLRRHAFGGAVLLRGVRRERLNAAHGSAVWATAVWIT